MIESLGTRYTCDVCGTCCTILSGEGASAGEKLRNWCQLSFESLEGNRQRYSAIVCAQCTRLPLATVAAATSES